jgi:hypothetical protein
MLRLVRRTRALTELDTPQEGCGLQRACELLQQHVAYDTFGPSCMLHASMALK